MNNRVIGKIGKLSIVRLEEMASNYELYYDKGVIRWGGCKHPFIPDNTMKDVVGYLNLYTIVTNTNRNLDINEIYLNDEGTLLVLTEDGYEDFYSTKIYAGRNELWFIRWSEPTYSVEWNLTYWSGWSWLEGNAPMQILQTDKVYTEGEDSAPYEILKYLNEEDVTTLQGYSRYYYYSYYDWSPLQGMYLAILPSNTKTIGQHLAYTDGDLREWNQGNNSYPRLTPAYIILPDGLETIEAEGFYGSNNLREINIPDSVESIGDYAFWSCGSLLSIKIGKGVREIGAGITRNYIQLSSITVNSKNPYYDSREDCNAIINTEWNALIAGCNTTFIPESVKYIGPEAFKEGNISNVKFSEGLLEIEDLAFYSCTGISRLLLPKTLTYIGDYAFYMAEMTYIEIPGLLEYLGRYAFAGCPNLTTVVIQNKVTSIGDYTFEGDDHLSAIVLSDDVESIGSNVFFSCSNLKNITLPKNLLSLGRGCFSYSGLIIVEIPENIESIPEYGFYYCKSLVAVNFNKNLLTINAYAFENCSALINADIPDTVTSIGAGAFASCSSLASITIPENLLTLGLYAFNGCSKITKLTYNAKNLLVTSGYSLAVVFPTTITEIVFGDNVETIPKYFMYQNKNIVSVVLPKTLLSIGTYAFYSCSALTTVEFSDILETIDTWAFGNCSKLDTITLPEKLQAISIYAFYYSTILTLNMFCTNASFSDDVFYSTTIGKVNIKSLKQWMGNTFKAYSSSPIYRTRCFYLNDAKVTGINIPVSVTKVNNYIFSYNQALTAVNFHDKVTYIGTLAFYYCSNIIELTLPDSISYIGLGAFGECSSLRTINVPEAVTELNGTTFAGCTNLLAVTLPSTLTKLSGYEFNACTNLTEITIPESVISLGSGCFCGDTALQKVTILGKITSIPYETFDTCTALVDVTLPNTITSIGEEAFYKCKSLTLSSVSQNVTSIGKYAFFLSSVTNVNIGKNLTSLTTRAFAGCSMETISVDPDNPNYSGDTTSNCIMNKERTLLIVGCKNTVIPDTITSIADYAFYLITVSLSEFPSSVKTIGLYSFWNCDKITTLTLPETITSIGANAFQYCYWLTDLYVNTKSLSTCCFYGCTRLERVTLSANTTSIGLRAFYSCNALKTITCYATKPPTLGDSYTIASTVTAIYVPSDSVATYKTATNWKNFSSKIYAITE